MKKILITIISLSFVLACGQFNDQESSLKSGKIMQPGQPEKIKAIGTVLTNILALGGETTGIILRAGESSYELRFSDELKTTPSQFKNQTVRAEGNLNFVVGIEVPMRVIIEVTDISSNTSNAKEGLTLAGTISSSTLAIGAESNQYVLRTSDHTFELDFDGSRVLQDTAQDMVDKQATIIGDLVVKPGLEIPFHYIIKVIDIY